MGLPLLADKKKSHNSRQFSDNQSIEPHLTLKMIDSCAIPILQPYEDALGLTIAVHFPNSSIFTMGSDIRLASYNSILKQIVDVIFDPAKPELVDIENKSAGLRDLIKTGFR